MRILIAGGAGFVGGHLARRLLDRGHHVDVVDSLITGRRANIEWLAAGPGGDRLRFVHRDIVTLPAWDDPLDAVLHLASPASPNDYLRHPIETMEAGSTGTRRLLEIASAHRARFLLASTSEVYGDPEFHPQPEEYWGRVNPIGPRSVYDEAKRFAEALTSAYARHAGLSVRIARIFNTYGPRMRLDDGRVIPTFVAQALRGQPLTVYGDGSQTRSYCFVDDLVDGLEHLLGSEAEGPMNLGNDEEFTVLETARRVLELTGGRSGIAFRPLPADDPRVRRPDLRRARRELGWSPRVALGVGLTRTVADLAARIRAGERAERGPCAGERRPVGDGRETDTGARATRDRERREPSSSTAPAQQPVGGDAPG